MMAAALGPRLSVSWVSARDFQVPPPPIDSTTAIGPSRNITAPIAPATDILHSILWQRETEAAVRIQTQARARAARAKREQHRQRHAARVGSIRSSGRAAAEDLRALSRPGTAAGGTGGAGGSSRQGEGAPAEEVLRGEDALSVLDGATEALLPISLGAMSMGSMDPASPASAAAAAAASRSFSLVPAIEVAAVRTPSSIGSPASTTAASAAVAAVTASVESPEARAVGGGDGNLAAGDDVAPTGEGALPRPLPIAGVRPGVRPGGRARRFSGATRA